MLLATAPRSDSRTSDHALRDLYYAGVLNPVHRPVHPLEVSLLTRSFVLLGEDLEEPLAAGLRLEANAPTRSAGRRVNCRQRPVKRVYVRVNVTVLEDRQQLDTVGAFSAR